MKKKLYYVMHHSRGESILNIFWQIFLVFGSPCRMLIEAFTRHDFGERYFRFSFAITISAFLLLWPFRPSLFPTNPFGASDGDISLVPYITWYIYVALFLFVSFQHHKAMRHGLSVFDFTRYSQSRGIPHDVFLNFTFRGKRLDVRAIECWLEPAPFFLGGLLLALAGQYLGWLLMFSAVIYALDHRHDYNKGDNYVLDTIDQMILNTDRDQTFLGPLIPSTGRVRLPRDPGNEAQRRKMRERLDALGKDAANNGGSDDGIPIAK